MTKRLLILEGRQPLDRGVLGIFVPARRVRNVTARPPHIGYELRWGGAVSMAGENCVTTWGNSGVVERHDNCTTGEGEQTVNSLYRNAGANRYLSTP